MSVQPYYDVLEGEAGSINRVAQFITSAQSASRNDQTEFYVYAAWPGTGGNEAFDYSSTWLTAYDGTHGSRMTRDYFERLMTGLYARDDLDAGRIHMIPVGEVLFELDQRMKAGEIAGFSDAGDLYRDSYHMNTVGRYAAAMTVVATVWGESPVGLTVPSVYGADPTVDAATALAVQETVWDVVRAHQFTGVPEPTGALFGTGALLLLARRRPGRAHRVRRAMLPKK